MRSISLAIFAIFFASCHNDVPSLPTIEEVQGYQYCKYNNANNKCNCKSTYEISEKSCGNVGGELFEKKEDCDAACKEVVPL